MSDDEYLDEVLVDQTLADGSEELTELRERRAEVEEELRGEFGSGPSIRYGGSYAKGTMNRESYDLDIICYFARDDESAGTSLQEIYEAVEALLQGEYWVERKGSAVRLHSLQMPRMDFHIDVVPGRFVNGKEGDVHLFRSGGDKNYLKTNLETHLSHVKDSGVRPAIRLMKLWAKRFGIGIKTFALELLVIKILDGEQNAPLSEQIQLVLEEFRDHSDVLAISDPANSNNDLSELLSASVRGSLRFFAEDTLRKIEDEDWESVFGVVKKEAKVAALSSMAARAEVRPKPYYAG